ncbi:ABC transporter ATP-binding protein [Legionella sp. 16cNR16C]|uniref:ABC transporter ATP-binding protein n=1 Tax=Legionella sp. 16cNR16C TaxID=2905656 RepID=UPI001E4CBA77|nr:ATP-binding cassette domain-containing protein [Legionella sp. 16cNR16C]MCE3046272.1 ATP-binding cassette domain-containing protein [Legionella sp. 16cNR16C]
MVSPIQSISLHHLNYQVQSGNEQLLILRDINLRINSGMTIAITGVSGSGKTSLLNIMAGLELPTSGQVYYNETDITQLDEDSRASLRAERIGFIFQSFQLLPNFSALENIMLPLEITNRKNALAIALQWLDQVGLARRAHHFPSQLSGGEQQRIAIARAFAITPSILFADEPTGNLDKKTGQHIIDLLFELNSAHRSTLVIVTHDESLAARCHTHWPLAEGQLKC